MITNAMTNISVVITEALGLLQLKSKYNDTSEWQSWKNEFKCMINFFFSLS